jgi:hypothetical protein
MKKNVVITQVSLLLLLMVGCQKESKLGYGQVLDVNISLQEDELYKNASNMLTVSLKNRSEDMVSLSQSSFILEFTSYSGSVRKSYPLDISSETIAASEVKTSSILIKNEFVRSFDLKKIVDDSQNESKFSLPADDYTVNLIMSIKPGSRSAKNEKVIRSNYLDVQVKG